MRFEGGFQGRCNKLVDGCYSFWQAGLLPLLHRALHAQGEPGRPLAGGAVGGGPAISPAAHRVRKPECFSRGVEVSSVCPGFRVPGVEPPALGTRAPTGFNSGSVVLRLLLQTGCG